MAVLSELSWSSRNCSSRRAASIFARFYEEFVFSVQEMNVALSWAHCSLVHDYHIPGCSSPLCFYAVPGEAASSGLLKYWAVTKEISMSQGTLTSNPWVGISHLHLLSRPPGSGPQQFISMIMNPQAHFVFH